MASHKRLGRAERRGKQHGKEEEEERERERKEEEKKVWGREKSERLGSSEDERRREIYCGLYAQLPCLVGLAFENERENLERGKRETPHTIWLFSSYC